MSAGAVAPHLEVLVRPKVPDVDPAVPAGGGEESVIGADRDSVQRGRAASARRRPLPVGRRVRVRLGVPRAVQPLPGPETAITPLHGGVEMRWPGQVVPRLGHHRGDSQRARTVYG